MQLSRTVTYAVQALVLLAQAPRGSATACGKLAQQGDMPKRYLLQILRALVERGVLDSVTGVSGGYLLKKRPRSITLLDIVEAIDGSLEPKIPRDVRLAKSVRNKLLTRSRQVSAVLQRELRRITIADLTASRAVK